MAVRARRHGIAILVAFAAAAPGAARAGGPGLVAVFAPPASRQAGPVVATVTDAAEAAGAVVVDLSPEPAPRPASDRALARGIEAYHDFRYDDALAELSRGVAEASGAGAAGLSPAALSDLFLYRALVLRQQGDTARAWEDFVRAAAIAPTRSLDPVRFPPKAVETFGRALEAVADKPSAEIEVRAGEACEASIDGRAVTPGEPRAVPHGEHFVRVACPGRPPYGARVAVSDDTAVRPQLPAPAPPAAGAVAAIARERGATRAVLATLTDSAAADPTLLVRAIDPRTGEERDRALVAVGRPGATAEARRVVRALLAPALPERPAREREPRRWWKSPYLWGAAGVVLGAAALAPLAFGKDGGGGFDVRVGGALPP